jgi:hypothetical protein
MALTDVITDTQHNTTSLPYQIPSNTPIILYNATLRPGEEILIPIIITALSTGRVDLLGLVIANNAKDVDEVAVATFYERFEVNSVASCSTSIRPAKAGPGYLIELEVNQSTDRC